MPICPRSALRRLGVAFLLAASVAGPPALAQPAPGIDAESLQAGRELMEAMGQTQIARAVLGQIRELVLARLLSRNPDREREAREIVDQFLIPEFEAALPELIELQATLWAGSLTIEELRELAAFYRSPVGRKAIEITPELTRQNMRLGGLWGQRVEQEALRKHQDAIRAKGLAL